MKWDMDVEDIEAVTEKIWDLHDKLSDAIHSISQTHFLNSIQNLRKSEKRKVYGDSGDGNRSGFVFIKDFQVSNSDYAVHEAKSLNAIRSALENLEDQLEFFHTVQIQQRAERDAAIARLEQSRIVLAMRLAEHHGKKYKVIEEALAFVGDVNEEARYVSTENVYMSGGNSREGKKSNILISALISSVNFAKKSLNLDNMGGILGNAALVAISMIAMLHLHQVSYKEHPQESENVYNNRNLRKPSQQEASPSSARLRNLDVLMARG